MDNKNEVDPSQKKENRGGKRIGAGRTAIFENPVIINFKTEKDLKGKVKSKYGKSLNSLFNSWLLSLLDEK